MACSVSLDAPQISSSSHRAIIIPAACLQALLRLAPNTLVCTCTSLMSGGSKRCCCAWQRMTAILHCGHWRGSQERKPGKAGFLRVLPDGANFQYSGDGMIEALPCYDRARKHQANGNSITPFIFPLVG